MCGGSIDVIHLKGMEKISDFWKVASGVKSSSMTRYTTDKSMKIYENFGIFFEVMTGCENQKCVFQCSARLSKPNIQIKPKVLQSTLRRSLFGDFPIFLYGMGNVDTYPFKELNDGYSYPYFSICITPSISEKNLQHLYKLLGHRHYILANINTVEEAIWANQNDEKLYAVKLPITSDNNYIEIFSRLRGNVIFKPIDSLKPNYVPPEEFSSRMEEHFGLDLKFPEYKITSGFKPVITKIEEGYKYFNVTMRRCFHNKKELVLHGKSQSFYEEDLPDLLEFYNYSPDCSKCKGSTWKGHLFSKNTYNGYIIKE